MAVIRKNADNYKISFRCLKQPEAGSELSEFVPEQFYTGRTYNGLFEVSAAWGKGKPTFLLSRKQFHRYFELVLDKANHL